MIGGRRVRVNDTAGLTALRVRSILRILHGTAPSER
jgi:hypothetical protein